MSSKGRIKGWIAIAFAALMGIAASGSNALAIVGPTSLSACGTISVAGAYVLTTSLTSSGTCFTITVSNVALDFKNHKITGNGTGSGIDDGGNALRNIAIANGTISNFATGINFPTNPSGSESADSLDKMKISGNTGAGVNIVGCCNTFTNSSFNMNGGD